MNIGILVRKDYWIQPAPGPGNQSNHRSVPRIIKALQRAGAHAELIFPGDAPRPFNGYVLPGGGDLHPAFYGERVGPGMDADSLDPEFDRFQLSWARRILAAGRPVLGICRGMQVLNVAAGGSLVQDLPRQQLDHCPQRVLDDARRRPEAVHGVRLAGALAELLGARRQVNSIHHQSVDRLGQGWEGLGWADDGVLEAFAQSSRPWQRGVQFHPEDMPEFQPIFDQLVEDAARKRP